MTDTRKNGEKSGKPTPPVEHQFKPGNPGRPKGSRNKLGEAFIEALHDDFKEHGVKAIETVRVDRPHEYLKVVAGLLPKEVKLDVGPLDEIGDDELAAIVAAARAAVAATAKAGSGDGASGTGEPAEGVSTLQ
jgi:hypothetical protein